MLAIAQALHNLKDSDEELQDRDVISDFEKAFIAAMHHIHLDRKHDEKGALAQKYLLCLRQVKNISHSYFEMDLLGKK